MLRNVLVILAILGLAVPRLALPCCAKPAGANECGSADGGCDQDRAVAAQPAGCCSKCEPPPSAPEKTDHSSHPAPQPGGCTGCSLICCVNLAMLPSAGPIQFAPAPAEQGLASGTESAPASVVPPGIFRPPRF